MARGNCLQRHRCFEGDHLQCKGWAGGTKYSAVNGPGGGGGGGGGGGFWGGTTYSMTEPHSMHKLWLIRPFCSYN